METISELKKRYFETISKENYPKTPDITKQADELESQIKKLLKGKKNEKGRKE